MKRLGLLIVLGILGFSGAWSTSLSYSNPCDSPFSVYVPNLKCGVELTGGAVILRPSAGNLAWGVVTDFLPFVSPNWHIQTLNPDYQPGFIVGARYTFPRSGVDAALFWTHLDTHDSKSVTVTPVEQWVSPFTQTGPGTGETDYDPTGVGLLTVARASVRFFYDIVNLDLGIYANLGCRVQVRLFSGLSGVRIREKLISVFSHPSGLPVVSLNNTSTFGGVGPRLGFENTYRICGNWRFVGQLAGTLLFGGLQPAQFKFAGSSEATSAAGIGVNREQVSSNRVWHTVPAIDAKLALRYALCFCRCYVLTAEAGYMGVIYIDPIRGYEANTNVLPLELASLSVNSMKQIECNFSAHGPYASVSVGF